MCRYGGEAILLQKHTCPWQAQPHNWCFLLKYLRPYSSIMNDLVLKFTSVAGKENPGNAATFESLLWKRTVVPVPKKKILTVENRMDTPYQVSTVPPKTSQLRDTQRSKRRQEQILFLSQSRAAQIYQSAVALAPEWRAKCEICLIPSEYLDTRDRQPPHIHSKNNTKHMINTQPWGRTRQNFPQDA